MSEWDVIIGVDEVQPTSKTMQGAKIPELPQDNPLWQFTKPRSSAVCAKVQKDDFMDAIVGDCPTPAGSNLNSKALNDFTKLTASVDLAKVATDQQVELMLKAGGIAGRNLKNALMKSPMTLSEAMGRMLFNFQEFFSVTEQKLMQKQIAALDLPGFLEMINSKVINAQI